MSFAQDWQARVLHDAPLIAPVRSFVYPRLVQGEDEALDRGAMRLEVRPAAGGAFLATCVRGFADSRVPTGVWSTPRPWEMCAVAGGYAYMVDTRSPERCEQIPLRPVVEVLPLPEDALLLFAGFHHLIAWGADGLAWETKRLSWEGVRVNGVERDGDGVRRLHGLGWEMSSDEEREFAVDLLTGEHRGGGYTS